jgi:hypothetical protein
VDAIISMDTKNKRKGNDEKVTYLKKASRYYSPTNTPTTHPTTLSIHHPHTPKYTNWYMSEYF